MPAKKPAAEPPPLEELELSDAIQAERAATFEYLAPGATAFEPWPPPPDQNDPAAWAAAIEAAAIAQKKPVKPRRKASA
jgi:hypothetical protein